MGCSSCRWKLTFGPTHGSVYTTFPHLCSNSSLRTHPPSDIRSLDSVSGQCKFARLHDLVCITQPPIIDSQSRDSTFVKALVSFLLLVNTVNTVFDVWFTYDYTTVRVRFLLEWDAITAILKSSLSFDAEKIW